MTGKAAIAVVGGGIIGLHTALEARQQGHPVTIYCPPDQSQNCSFKAAASFKPHAVLYDPRVHTMLIEGWDVYDKIAQKYPASGVRLHTHWEAASAPKPLVQYLSVMRSFHIIDFPKVPGGYAHGWRYSTFFVDTTVYLPWLKKMLQELGVQFVAIRPFQHLQELATLKEETIFNCTGLGARELCDDKEVVPMKGQVVLIGPRHDMDWSISADGFYVYPRANDTVLGGTTEEECYSDVPDNAVAQLLVRGNQRILPHITLADVREVKVGLRPYRKTGVRVEKELIAGKTVVHNYGHGGSGVTLAPGSAKLALSLLA